MQWTGAEVDAGSPMGGLYSIQSYCLSLTISTETSPLPNCQYLKLLHGSLWPLKILLSTRGQAEINTRKLAAPKSSPQVKYINIIAPLHLGWNNSEVGVQQWILEFPNGLMFHSPTKVIYWIKHILLAFFPSLLHIPSTCMTPDNPYPSYFKRFSWRETKRDNTQESGFGKLKT